MTRPLPKRLRATAERFTDRYQERRGDAAAAIQREVMGADIGVNGFTTIAQAGRIARVLRLGPGVRLLDLGSGNGWPGVQLAKTTRCHLVMSDLPRPALRRAVKRARRERISGRAATVQASATALPFKPGSFEAISHTDVMC